MNTKYNIFGLFILSFFCMQNIYSAEKPNMASADPGFEQKTKFWYIPNPKGYTFFEKEGKRGNILLLSNQAETPAKRGGLYRKNFIPVEEGKTYTFEADFKGELTGGYASILLSVFDIKNGKQHYLKTFESTRITDTKGEWVRISMTFTIPEGGKKVHYGLFAKNFCGKASFDNVNMFEGDSYTLPLVDKGLALDGKWDDSFPAKALKIHDFNAFPVKNNMPAAEKTVVYLARTNDTIYGQALLYHAPGKVLLAKAGKKDGSLWADDSLEFFITLTNAERPFYHFMFNTNGDVYDALESNRKWDSSFRAKGGKKDEKSHFIQFALPLKDIGFNAELDAHMHDLSWKINFTRNHPGMVPRYSTFAPVLVFRDPASFISVTSPGKNGSREIWGRYRNKGSADSKNIRQQKVWKIKNPLYKELFSNKENPFKGESAFIWPRPIEAKRNFAFALQYGMEYSLETIFEEYRKNRLHPYSTDSFTRISEFGRKTGVGFIQYAPYYMNNHSYIYNPATEKAFLKAVKKTLDKHSPGMWGVTIGDEAFSQTVRRIVARGNDPAYLASDPALKKALEEVKIKYGYGKYGLPKTVSADAPFDWIALRKWYFARLLPIQKDLYLLAKKYKGSNGKEMVVVSHDHVDWAFMQQVSRFAPYVDIMTAQSVPMNDPTRQNLAFRAKLLKDLTGKSVWLCVHIEPYNGHYTAEETAALLSEAARGGNTGLQLWNYDYMADRQGMGSSQFDYYGHRPRWDAVMDALNRMQKDPLLQFPEEDFAILVSDTSAFARPKMYLPQYEGLFNLAGPGAETAFKFISDTQLTDKMEKLENWKFVIIPKMDYIDEELIPLFRKYVDNGGILLCFDPDFMQYAPSGKSCAKAREELFGVKNVPVKNITGITFTSASPFKKLHNKAAIPLSNINWALQKLDKDVQIWAKYQNGLPAMSMKKYAKGGMAIMCSVDLQLYLSANKKWHEVFRDILSSFGAKTSRKIWRFQYPAIQEKEPEFKDKCLTGNHFYFWNNTVTAPANIRLPGAYYTVNTAPDGEKAAGKNYSFTDGRLTNRMKAPTAGDLANLKRNKLKLRSGKLHKGLFADSWTKKDPLQITFHFGKKVKVKRMELFYSGELPGGELVIAGKKYPFKGTTTDKITVKKLVLTIPETAAENLQLNISGRKNEILTISEIEFWGR